MKDCTGKNGHVNASTMKDVVDACCIAEPETAERKNIDVNMKAATTVGNIKESSHGATYANGKDETDLSRVPDRLASTRKSDMGINAMVDTVFAATAVDILQMKGMISFIFFVEQFQMPVEFLISNRLFVAFAKFCKSLSVL